MAYRLRKKDSVTAAVRRLIREGTDQAIHELKAATVGEQKGLHEARKHIKKMRSLIRLVRARLDQSGKLAITLLTEAARPLSGLRDAQAMVEAFDALATSEMQGDAQQAYAPLRRQLVEQRDTSHENDGNIDSLIALPIEHLERVRAMSQKWTIRPNGFAALSRGLRKCYAQAIDARRLALDQPSDDHFHEWRKHVKHHWYHLRLLRGLWPRLLSATATELGTLSDLLGDDHDMTVMRERIQKQQTEAAVEEKMDEDMDRARLFQMIDARQEKLRMAARTLGSRIFAEKPKALTRRLRIYWDAWHAESGMTAKSP